MYIYIYIYIYIYTKIKANITSGLHLFTIIYHLNKYIPQNTCCSCWLYLPHSASKCMSKRISSVTKVHSINDVCNSQNA